MIKNKFEKTLKTLRSDNRGEYISNEMEEFTKSHGNVHQYSVPHSQQQNGVVERKKFDEEGNNMMPPISYLMLTYHTNFGQKL